jgi:hypothetical protein
MTSSAVARYDVPLGGGRHLLGSGAGAVELRPYGIRAIRSAAPGFDRRGNPTQLRSWVRCPFCGETSLVFLWSLSGSGKRCACGARLGYFAAARVRGCSRRDRVNDRLL